MRIHQVIVVLVDASLSAPYPPGNHGDTPRSIAPPIPTTTPMTIRFWEESRPDLLEPLSSGFTLGARVEVAEEVETGMTPLVV